MASNSSDTLEDPGVSFIMNDGTIESVYDGLFIQHLYASELDITVVNGTITSLSTMLRSSPTRHILMLLRDLNPPAFVGTPSRPGYTFAGWNPTVVDTVTADVTYTATWRLNVIVVPTSYAITVKDADHGDVSANKSSATYGQTVTISVDPDSGYVLETLVVLDRSGNEITLTRISENTYSFQMPACKVTVYATFIEDNTMLNYFVDVFAGDYYYNAVLWAVENGITNGTSATTFSPDADCTRAQIVISSIAAWATSKRQAK